MQEQFRQVGKFPTSGALVVMRGRSIKHGPSGSYNHSKSKLRSEKVFKCYNYGNKDYWNLNNKDSNPQKNIGNPLDDRDVIVCEAIMTIEKIFY